MWAWADMKKLMERCQEYKDIALSQLSEEELAKGGQAKWLRQGKSVTIHEKRDNISPAWAEAPMHGMVMEKPKDFKGSFKKLINYLKPQLPF